MRKYIGHGYTNSQGIATLDYDADGTAISPSGYLGTGGGEIDIQAELHDDSSIVSGTYPVTDCIFYDDGVTGNLPSDWITGVISSSRDGTGTYWKNEQTAWKNVFLNKNGTSTSVSYDWENGLVIEFIIVSISTETVTLQHKDTNSIGLSRKLNDSSANDVIRIENNGETIVMKRNGVAVGNPTSAPPNGGNTIMFSFAPNGEIKIKDFKVYPI